MTITDFTLALSADTLDDIEKTRIGMQNRYGQMTRTGVDADGVERGFGLPEDSYAVMSVKGLVDGLAAQEKEATKILEKVMKGHPLAGWVKASKGVGLKQGARLIAAVGDPYWNTLHNRPRTVTEFWSYCGFGVAEDGGAVKRKKGVKSNWNAKAKMRAYLIAESCLKQKGSPYEIAYRERRAHTEAVHPDWTKGRHHNDALRIASKEILKDLWIATRDIYEARDNTI
jgi:hypothetical protein